MSFIDDILQGIVPSTLSNIYSKPLPQISSPDISFKPFGVTTSGLGGVSTTEGGGTAFNLSPEQRALQNQLFGGAGGFFGQAMQDTTGREADIYERIRAAQRPEEQRQALGLEERLFAQGRGGVRTNQYGGTPEQLAVAKAQAEAQNTAMLGAMQQAQAEQAQQASLGSQFMQQGYAPQANLLNALQGGLNVASMADVARRQQGEYDLQSQIANMQGLLGQQQGMSNLYGGVYGGLLSGLGGLLSGSGADGKPWWWPV